MSTATETQQSYVCEECYGTGRTRGEDGHTDLYADGEMRWRGYYPTNLCFCCRGTGIWPPPKAIRKGEQ
jgi:hypothetical protein